MGNEREEFFLMVDGTPSHPLVCWAKDEILRLEGLLGISGHKLDLAKARHTADKDKLAEMKDETGEVERLEGVIAAKDHKLDLAKALHISDKQKLKDK